MNDSGGRERDGHDAADPQAAHPDAQQPPPEHPARWTAPIIDAPVASGATDTEPGSATAGWGGDNWAWTAGDDVDATSPDIDHELARIEEAPTSRRMVVGTAALACFAILIGATQPKRADKARTAATQAPRSTTTSTTFLVTTTVPVPTTILSSATVVTRPPAPPPPSTPAACNVVTQLLGCH